MLTPTQKTTLKSHLAANTATINLGGTDFAINSADVLIPAVVSPPSPAVVASEEAARKVADWYNAIASPPYFAVRTDVPAVTIRNSIVGANYTPKDDPTAGNAAQATAASNYCMAKQQNLAFLGIFPGSGVLTFDATKALNVATLKDATTKLPSNTAFANQTGGWNTIIPTLQHACTIGEKLLAVVSTIADLQNAASARGTQYDGTNGKPDVPGIDASGNAIVLLSSQDIKDAWTQG